MRIKRYQAKKTAQEIQDRIFKNMSAGRKIEIGSQLWKLGKDIAGDKINYVSRRSKKSFGQYRQDS
ncbi:hypothetical protein KKD72_01560 [Patescibacteria group bacterium]|nr:hypothetical protein [Patescibacteria group bacterium]